jgi:hypothetical protein
MKVLYIIIFIFVFSAKANVQQIEADAKAFGKQIHEKNKNNVYKPEDLPSFTTANPKETNYYGNANGLEQAGAIEFQKDENTKMLLKTSEEKLKYSQEVKQLKENIISTGVPQDAYCIDGKCGAEFQNENADINNMTDSLTSLSIIQAIASDKDKLENIQTCTSSGKIPVISITSCTSKPELRIFKGVSHKCSNDVVGFSKCCSGSGLGNDLNLASCSSDEKTLALKQSKKLCHHVGTYCSKQDFFGGCLVKTQGYCCFDTTLTKAIQIQGRFGQLKINFGSGESPNCRGLKPEELEKIKMNEIDFSEFTSNLNPQINNIDKDLIQNQIHQTIPKKRKIL